MIAQVYNRKACYMLQVFEGVNNKLVNVQPYAYYVNSTGDSALVPRTECTKIE